MKVVKLERTTTTSSNATSSPSLSPLSSQPQLKSQTPPPKGRLIEGLSFLCWPIDDPFVALLRNGLIRSACAGRPFLQDRDMRFLLNRAWDSFSKEPNIVNLSIKSNTPFYVVGDIHG